MSSDTFTELLVGRNFYLQAEGGLFSISEPALRLSEVLSDMTNSIHVGSDAEGTKENPIHLGLSRFELESFLSLLNTRVWTGPPKLPESAWAAALHVATMYGFQDVRDFIIKQVDEQQVAKDYISRIKLALKCRVGKWIHPAYVSLCIRPEPMTAEEGEALVACVGWPVFAALYQIREVSRSPRRVELRYCSHGSPFGTCGHLSHSGLGPFVTSFHPPSIQEQTEIAKKEIERNEDLKVAAEYFD